MKNITHNGRKSNDPFIISACSDWTRVENFWAKVSLTADGCWPWTGATNRPMPGGYGQICVGRNKLAGAHRFSFILHNGPILPTSSTVNHVCMNTICVNPAHLEILSAKENQLLGTSPFAVNSRKNYCIRGHRFNASNTRIKKNGSRCCRACQKIHRAKHSNSPASA